VRIGDKYGYINKAGQVVIEPKFDYVGNGNSCSSFSEGLACVGIGGKIGYINASGKIVAPPQFDMATKFTNGLAQVSFGGLAPIRPGSDLVTFAGEFAYIDRTGKYVWKPTR
jgi:WG containing repeat